MMKDASIFILGQSYHHGFGILLFEGEVEDAVYRLLL
jgi:hypothetical protein